MKFDIKKFVTENIQLVVTGLIFVFMYVPIFVWMWDRWWARDSYYSHGILIPFVSAYLIWQKKDELQKLKNEPSFWGIALIVFGILLHMAGTSVRFYFCSGFSMIILFYGLCLYFFGKKVFKSILFPLIFLLFMVPVPLDIIAKTSFKLKLFAATIATDLLNNMGLPSVRSGSIIKMEHAYVVVDDVCSGLRSLISLTALGSLFAYWLNGPMYKRLILFFMAIPIALVTNVIRIILLSSIAEIWGSQYAIGFTHDASGFFVFGLAFLLLYAVGRLLE